MHSDRDNPARPYWYGFMGVLIGSAFCLFAVPTVAELIAHGLAGAAR